VTVFEQFNKRFIDAFYVENRPVFDLSGIQIQKILTTGSADDVRSLRDDLEMFTQELEGVEDELPKTDPYDFADEGSGFWGVTAGYNKKQTRLLLDTYCEGIVQILVKMKSPGRKFLHLTKVPKTLPIKKQKK
jgi:hypothetical protein